MPSQDGQFPAWVEMERSFEPMDRQGTVEPSAAPSLQGRVVAPGRAVRVTTGARLHFGLLGFAKGHYPFGGAGVMIERPATCVEIRSVDTARETRTDSRTAPPALVARLQDQIMCHWERMTGLPTSNLRLHVTQTAQRHIGLGSGTQMAMALALGLFRLHGRVKPTVEQLAESVQRGKRSSVGVLGFANGGFLLERGHQANAPIARSFDRVPVPSQWRFVLVRATRQFGASGSREKELLGRLAETPPVVTRRMLRMAEEEILPALRSGQIDTFADAVFEYGQMAGRVFSAVQGGIFANRHIEQLANSLRNLGARGVAQSSWGPTVSCIVESQTAAELLREQATRILKPISGQGPIDIQIAAPCNSPATYEEI